MCRMVRAPVSGYLDAFMLQIPRDCTPPTPPRGHEALGLCDREGMQGHGCVLGTCRTKLLPGAHEWPLAWE